MTAEDLLLVTENGGLEIPGVGPDVGEETNESRTKPVTEWKEHGCDAIGRQI